MTDLATARDCFLAKVDYYAPGQAVRFTPALDALIGWSEANGLVFSHSKVDALVKFAAPGSRPAFWTALPRSGDGAKFTLLGEPKFPDSLRAAAREELARIDRKEALPDAVPVLPFTALIWEPYRTRILDLMARLLDGVKQVRTGAAEVVVGV